MNCLAKRLNLAGLVVLALLGAGCPSVSTFTTAKTLGDGKNEFAFSPTFYGVTPTALGGEDEDAKMFYSGAIDFVYRRGIGDHFDLGVSLSGFGQLGVEGKVNLLDSEHVALAIDPRIGGVFVGASDVAGGYLQVNLPFLIDLVLGKRVRLTLSPKYSGIYAFGVSEDETASAFSHWVGGAVGLEIKLGRIFRLMPHGGVLYWANRPTDISEAGVLLLSGGIACKFVF